MLDEWVATAAKLGDDTRMMEALAVEDRRRYLAELLSQAKAQVKLGGKASIEVSVDSQKAMAERAGASFVVVMKKLSDMLLTWVLSGDEGKLVYHRSDNISDTGRQHEIAQWVKDATFVEWGRWQRQLDCARRKVQQARKGLDAMDEGWWEKLIEDTIPADMEAGVNSSLWKWVRQVEKFRKAIAKADSPVLSKLRECFFDKAERAMARLNDLLWTPIMEECGPVREALLKAKNPCPKPVRRAG